jgi:hypothetical protein
MTLFFPIPQGFTMVQGLGDVDDYSLRLLSDSNNASV